MNLQEVKRRVPPLSFYQRELGLSVLRPMKNWCSGGLCPFHDDKTEGSFYVNISSGAFKCFSCGAKGGDILAFKMLKDGLSFVEALREVSNKWEVRI